MIEITNSLDWDLWDEFVFNNLHGNIFQTSQMERVYRKTENYEPISIAAVESNTGKILAVLLSVIIKEKKGIVSLFSSRSIISGGPLYVPQEEGYLAVQKLMKHYEALVQRKSIYTQIRNMHNTEEIRSFFESMGYVYEDHLNYLLDLKQTPEQILKNMKKSRRGDIKNSEKNGIKVDKINNSSEIKDFYKFIQETYKRSRLPLVDISLFESAFNELTPHSLVDFYLATQNNNTVGSCAMLKYRNTVFNWYMGSQSDINFVDSALVWHILKEHANKGGIFDFGGAGNPNEEYGVRDFKKRFGGEEVNFGRYLKVHDKLRKNIAEAGFEMCRKISPSFLNNSK